MKAKLAFSLAFLFCGLDLVDDLKPDGRTQSVTVAVQVRLRHFFFFFFFFVVVVVAGWQRRSSGWLFSSFLFLLFYQFSAGQIQGIVNR
jgi:hypothetical protein